MNSLMTFLRRWFARPDLALHFVAGFAIVVLLASLDPTLPLADRVIAAQIVVSALGWAKEHYFDRPRPGRHTVDGWDAFATAIGGQAGGAVFILFGALV
jgi:hypothetical protein